MCLYTTKVMGISLFELVCALSLCSIILAVLMMQLWMMSAALQQQEKVSQSMHHGQVTLQLLQQAIKKAGFLGCKKRYPDAVASKRWRDFMSPQQSLQVGENRLEVHYADSSGAKVIEMLTDKILEVQGDLDVQPGDEIWLSDCQHAEVAVVQHWGEGYLRLAAPLHFHYQAGGLVTRLLKLVYTASSELYREGMSGGRRSVEAGVDAFVIESLSHHRYKLSVRVAGDPQPWVTVVQHVM